MRKNPCDYAAHPLHKLAPTDDTLLAAKERIGRLRVLLSWRMCGLLSKGTTRRRLNKYI